MGNASYNIMHSKPIKKIGNRKGESDMAKQNNSMNMRMMCCCNCMDREENTVCLPCVI